jgi:hypothetical protein
MHTHTITNYNDFRQLAHQVATSNRGVVVETEDNKKVAIVPLKERHGKSPKPLSGFVAELREKNAHRSTDEIEDIVDRAVDAVRYGTPHA